MGCVNGRTSMNSPNERLEKFKTDGGGEKPIGQRQFRTRSGNLVGFDVENRIVGENNDVNIVIDGGGGGGRGEETPVARETERENNGYGKVSKRRAQKKIEGDELVDGWPKWLVDNIPGEVLAGLVPRSADSYDKLAKIGHGTYSNVYKARDRNTRKLVALKKVRFDTSESESVKFMAREIMILQKLDHPNVIKLEGLATSRMQYSLYLVFSFMQSDLTRIISSPGMRLTEAQIKCYMQQLLSGLQHCHERGILHRDIKASNLLIDKRGMLKIADFGLATSFYPKPRRPLTSRVVTLWYRAPELLLGSTDYGVGIDLWSAGCLLAEMFVGRPIMPGRTEVEQLHKIFKLCGSPMEDYWKRMKFTTSFRPPHYKPSFEEAFRDFPTSSRGLLTTLLDLDPSRRGCAASALHNDFFCSSPLACDLSALPVVYKHEDDPSKSKRRKQKTSRKGKSSQANHKDLPVDDQTTEQVRGDFEEKSTEPKMHSQEMATSASSTASTSSGSKLFTREGSTIASLSPVLLSNQKRFPSTEGHPNALKNIQNFTLLQASITDIINHSEGSGIGPFRRSFSTLDFRTFDAEKMSKLFGLDKD
ncbi:Serine/threonine-protein kinase [Quillaja saponaria]|uniref:Serine/threonine-protein kinase n=1 Tax=Quillaja saponaria TaxID=32244 RepID=A0AAD7P7U2_QUISA|nr:Serine/threonine-protein kinase [Quillaja saponaria]